MKFIQVVCLLFSSFACIAYGMDEQKVLHQAQVTPFGPPDLMPREAKDLINRLNNPNQHPPRIIMFSGPPGSGKTTLIKDFVAQIKGAQMWVDMPNMIESYAAYPNEEAIAQSIKNDLVVPTFKAAQKQSASYAALIIQNLDAISMRQNRSVCRHIFEHLFKNGYNQPSQLLLVCEAQETPITGTIHIPVSYPDKRARAALIAHFLGLNYVPNINLLVQRTANFSISRIKELVERADIAFASRNNPTPALPKPALVNTQADAPPLNTGVAEMQQNLKRRIQELEREENTIIATATNATMGTKSQRLDDIQDELFELHTLLTQKNNN